MTVLAGLRALRLASATHHRQVVVRVDAPLVVTGVAQHLTQRTVGHTQPEGDTHPQRRPRGAATMTEGGVALLGELARPAPAALVHADLRHETVALTHTQGHWR